MDLDIIKKSVIVLWQIFTDLLLKQPRQLSLAVLVNPLSDEVDFLNVKKPSLASLTWKNCLILFDFVIEWLIKIGIKNEELSISFCEYLSYPLYEVVNCVLDSLNG